MSTITKNAYEGDIVSRLRNWRGLLERMAAANSGDDHRSGGGE